MSVVATDEGDEVELGLALRAQGAADAGCMRAATSTEEAYRQAGHAVVRLCLASGTPIWYFSGYDSRIGFSQHSPVGTGWSDYPIPGCLACQDCRRRREVRAQFRGPGRCPSATTLWRGCGHCAPPWSDTRARHGKSGGHPGFRPSHPDHEADGSRAVG